MVEQSDTGKAHGHTVLVTGIDHIVIANGTARLCNIGYTALGCSLYVVPEREESIGAKAYTLQRCQILSLLCSWELFRLLSEELLPVSFTDNIQIVL